jgi:hypothetical protein
VGAVEDSKLSIKVLKTSKSFMETKLRINILKPLLMAFAAEAHLVEGQLISVKQTIKSLKF